jgi:predicted phage-related endonuclease
LGAPDADQRHTFIGASEAFELLNERQYGRGCSRALAYRKLQTPEDVPSASAKERAMSMRSVLQRGHLLEDLAARLYMATTGRSLMRRTRLVRNADHHGAGVHTDRIIHAYDEDHPTGDCEIKTHQEGVFLHILRDGLPPAHNLQIQWSLFCTGHAWGAFVILGVFGGLPLKHFDVRRDPTLMNLFAFAVEDFWNTLQAGELPPQLPEASDLRCKVCPYRLTCRGEALDPGEYRRLMREREGKRTLTEITNEELDQALADRALILSEMEALDHDSAEDPGALQLVTKRIKELLGDTEAAAVNKHWKVYCSDHLWSGLDIARLREEQPEIYKRYFVKERPTGTKRLRVYAIHDGRAA